MYCIIYVLIKYQNFVYYFVCMGVLSAGMPVYLVPTVPLEASQRRVLDSWELELQMTVSYQVGPGG